MEDFSPKEFALLRSLRTPRRIQDFLNTFAMNFEESGETCMSPRRVLRERKAHCLEGAMLAAAALRVAGSPPLLFDLTTMSEDDDHVVALFREDGCWGAISHTNHAVLRFREPIYATLRELALSYFHEYFLDDGRKTLRSYSRPLNLARFDRISWMTTDDDLWEVAQALCNIPHVSLLTSRQSRRLRPADMIERAAGKLVVWRGTSRVR